MQLKRCYSTVNEKGFCMGSYKGISDFGTEMYGAHHLQSIKNTI